MPASSFAMSRGAVALTICTLAISIFLVAAALAQNYPARPVRLIVAFTPGGTTDITARLIADKMHDALGEVVAVENKPGANGAIAKFNAAMVGALNDPQLRERLHDIGTTPSPSSPEEFGDFLRQEIARWGRVIREKGLKGE